MLIPPRTEAAPSIDDHDRANQECGLVIQGYYTCNGSPVGCERKRFGGCDYCDDIAAGLTDKLRTMGGEERKARMWLYVRRFVSQDLQTEAFSSLYDLMGDVMRHGAATVIELQREASARQ